jgi:tetratricopeptide (TPR) repeat protein
MRKKFIRNSKTKEEQMDFAEYSHLLRVLSQTTKPPSNGSAWIADLDYSHINTGDMDKAIDDFTKAIALGLETTDVYHQRGLAYMGKKDHDKAIADFTRIIESNENYAAPSTLTAPLPISAGR